MPTYYNELGDIETPNYIYATSASNEYTFLTDALTYQSPNINVSWTDSTGEIISDYAVIRSSHCQSIKQLLEKMDEGVITEQDVYEFIEEKSKHQFDIGDLEDIV